MKFTINVFLLAEGESEGTFTLPQALNVDLLIKIIPLLNVSDVLNTPLMADRTPSERFEKTEIPGVTYKEVIRVCSHSGFLYYKKALNGAINSLMKEDKSAFMRISIPSLSGLDEDMIADQLHATIYSERINKNLPNSFTLYLGTENPNLFKTLERTFAAVQEKMPME